MAGAVEGEPGGIRSLLVLIRGEHGEAIESDLLDRHWRRSDLGRTLGWGEFRTIVNRLPPTPSTAYYRSQFPRSWWVTSEHKMLAGVLYAIECGNYQRGGCKGSEPTPIKFPEDRNTRIRDSTELEQKRLAQREHLRRRRAQQSKRKRR